MRAPPRSTPAQVITGTRRATKWDAHRLALIDAVILFFVPGYGEVQGTVVGHDSTQDCTFIISQERCKEFPRETKKDLLPSNEVDKSTECWKKGQWRILLTPEENRARKGNSGGSSSGVRLGCY